MIFPFYCGFTRSVVDQACKGDFDFLDAIMFGDHCVQVLGAADIVRSKLPNTRVHFYQLISAMSDPWTRARARCDVRGAQIRSRDLVGHSIDDASIRGRSDYSIETARCCENYTICGVPGLLFITAHQMQMAVQSSMVMDKATHTALLENLVAELRTQVAPPQRGTRVYLSGHFCQAPKPAYSH